MVQKNLQTGSLWGRFIYLSTTKSPVRTKHTGVVHLFNPQLYFVTVALAGAAATVACFAPDAFRLCSGQWPDMWMPIPAASSAAVEITISFVFIAKWF
jgi:hypothetical protein